MLCFNENDVVLYGNNGVCRVDAIETHQDGDYYVLVPVHTDRTKLLVPTTNEILVGRMRAVPSREVASQYIQEAAGRDARWISDSTKRKEHARAILHGGSEVELLVLIRSFCQHKQQMTEIGKKTSSSDNSILRCAQKRMRDEFSVIFDIEPDEVDDCIAQYE